MRAALRRLPSRLAPADPDRDRLAPLRAVPGPAAVGAARPLARLRRPGGGGSPPPPTRLGMFFVTAGYHRYFAHRAFRTSRAFQLVLAVGAQCTVQRGVLWWAGHHREHHRCSDGPRDVHSPTAGPALEPPGLVPVQPARGGAPGAREGPGPVPGAASGWSASYWVPPLTLGVAVAALGGWSVLVGGYFLGLFLVHHVTFTINSLAHRWGTQPYPTGDDSRNNALLAVLAFGEGWHNNHHWSPSSARQGFRWWQLDLTWSILRVLERLGVVRDLRPAPAADHPRQALPGPRLARPAGALLVALALALPRPAAARRRRRALRRHGEDPRRRRALPGAARGRARRRAARAGHHRLPRPRRRAASPSCTPTSPREPSAPSYAFLDLRTGKAERVDVGRGELRLEAGGRATTLARPDAPRHRPGTRPAGADLLAALAGGEVLRVTYAIPSRHAAYAFRIRAVGPDAGPRLRVRVELGVVPAAPARAGPRGRVRPRDRAAAPLPWRLQPVLRRRRQPAGGDHLRVPGRPGGLARRRRPCP